MRTFFTADHHFGHRAIIDMCARPFASIDEHDEALIELWNFVVGPRDQVFHLGDFSHRAGVDHAEKVLRRLNGSVHLIEGNHDKSSVRKLPWASVSQMKDVVVDGQRAFCAHYGMRVWPGQWRGSIMLYGHSHGRLPGNSRSLDVGVDCWGYGPVDLEQIRARLADLPEWQPEEIGDEPAPTVTL